MSGAEFLAAAGIVANLAQLVDYGKKVLDRLNEYREFVGELPQTFDRLSLRLEVLLTALGKTQHAVDSGALPERDRAALRRIIKGSKEKIKELDEIMSKALPAPGMSGFKRGWTAVKSLKYDGKIEKLSAIIEGYERNLIVHFSIPDGYEKLKPPPRPAPGSTVPFRRDPNFIDRQELFTNIEDRCKNDASRVALVGLGGVGKSQLAVEYSYRLRAQDPETWVFWIHAGSSANIQQGFAEIAEKAKIAAWDPTDPDRFKVVTRWLADEANGRWLMIIDNANDLSTFSSNTKTDGKQKSNTVSGPTEDMLALFPESSNGQYLITSRSRSTAYRLTGEHNDLITVDVMSKDESISLLRKKITATAPEEDAAALVSALDYMPLAITQAASYINENSPRATVRKYLDQLKEGDSVRTQLLEEDIYDARRDGEQSNSSIITWHISFEWIRRERKSAAYLLSLMSLFSTQGIPENLLHGQYEDGPLTETHHQKKTWKYLYRLTSRRNRESAEHKKEDQDFDEDWRILNRFSLITTDISGDCFAMHALVQFSTNKWLDLQGQLQFWTKRYLALMYSSFPQAMENGLPTEPLFPDPQDEEFMTTCDSLFPHACKALKCQPSSKEDFRTYIDLTKKIATYAIYQDKAMCELLWETTVRGHDIIFGSAHLRTTDCYCADNLRRLKERLGKWDDAETLQRRLVESRKAMYGTKHPETLKAVDALQYILSRNKKSSEAEEMFQSTFETRKNDLGASNAEVESLIQHHAADFWIQGKYEEAEALWREQFHSRNTNDAQNQEYDSKWHKQLYDLGAAISVFRDDWDETERLAREAMEYGQQFFDDDHQNLMLSSTLLGDVLVHQRKFDEAEPIYRNTIQTHMRVLGPEHENTLLTQLCFLTVLSNTNQLEEAENLALEIVKIRETQTIETGKSALAEAWHCLAAILHKKKNWDEALNLYENAYAIMAKELGESNSNTQEVLDNMTRMKEEMAIVEQTTNDQVCVEDTFWENTSLHSAILDHEERESQEEATATLDNATDLPVRNEEPEEHQGSKQKRQTEKEEEKQTDAEREKSWKEEQSEQKEEETTGKHNTTPMPVPDATETDRSSVTGASIQRPSEQPGRQIDILLELPDLPSHLHEFSSEEKKESNEQVSSSLNRQVALPA